MHRSWLHNNTNLSKKIVTWCLWSCLWQAILYTGAPAKPWQTFTTENGLADNSVEAIAEAADGTLWFATKGGVSRYDGSQWQTFSVRDGLADNSVQAITEAADGTLWFATGAGVSRYDGSQWQTFTTQDGLAHNLVNVALAETDGTLWFGTEGRGVSRYDGGQWQTFTTQDGLANNRVLSMATTSDGALWFGTRFGGVSRFDGNTWLTFTTQDGLADNTVEAIAVDTNGALWFGTRFGGVSRFDGNTWLTFTTQDGLADNTVHAIAVDTNGVLWFATEAGFSRYDGDTWQTFTTEDGLAENTVQAMLKATDTSLWLGTKGGVSRYDGDTWQSFTIEDGLAGNRIDSIVEAPDGKLWFASLTDGVSVFDGTNWQRFTTENGLVDNVVQEIYIDPEDIFWFATSSGVSRYDGNLWQSFTTEDGLAHNRVEAITADANGNLWFGTGLGASRYDGNTWQTFTTEDGLAHNFVADLLQDTKGRLWFATSGGISRYDGATWQSFTTEDGLADNFTISLLEAPDGSLWVGTFGAGVSRYDGNSWQTFTTRDGLGDNTVRAMAADANGNLWFATLGGGLSRYDGTIWQTLTVEDGLADNTVRALTLGADQSLWIGTWDGGVSRFRPPLHSLARIQVSRFPAPRLGSDRFAFAFRRGEFGTDALPLISYALISGGQTPTADAWTPFADLNGFEASGLTNGPWTLFTRAVDRYGHINPDIAAKTFTVDTTPPTVLLSQPIAQQNIHDQTAILGTVLDRSVPPDLHSYVLEYAAQENDSLVWRIDRLQNLVSGPVFNDTLAVWDTQGLHGPFALRLSAVDSLGHQSQTTVNLRIVSAAQTINHQTGGRLLDRANGIELYIPPQALSESVSITLSPLAHELVSNFNEPNLKFAGLAYAIEPSSLVFGQANKEGHFIAKPATLTLRFTTDDLPSDMVADRLALFQWSDPAQTWTRLGGTVRFDANTNAFQLSLALHQTGNLVLAQDLSTSVKPGRLSRLNCQPRIFGQSGFDIQTTISFDLGGPGAVNVKVYDTSGRLMRRITNQVTMQEGTNAVVWDGLDYEGDRVVDGLYIVAVEAADQVKTVTVGVLNK